MEKAAVLIPLIQFKDEWCLLFQQRALDIEMQPGDVCFPGGHTEDGETQEETVLREVSEELGVSPSQIELLRKMPEMQGPGGLIVTPFVGVLHDYEGSFDPKEVDHVFTVPLSWFEANPPECHEARYELLLPEDFPYELIRGGKDYPFRKLPHSMYFYRHPEAVIWGFTAKLVKRFLEDAPECMK